MQATYVYIYIYSKLKSAPSPRINKAMKKSSKMRAQSLFCYYICFLNQRTLFLLNNVVTLGVITVRSKAGWIEGGRIRVDDGGDGAVVWCSAVRCGAR